MAISLKERIKVIAASVFEPKIVKELLSQLHSGYLLEQGWFKSFNSKKPVDKNGEPIPWISYPCIDFLSSRLNSEMILFEYGSGNSTLYYASKVKKVLAVEHNEKWFDIIKSKLPSNVELIFTDFSMGGEYSHMSKVKGGKFDIIIVDGVDRNNCIKYSSEALSDRGIIILDDSERTEYSEGILFLVNKKFKRLDFWGIAPSVLFKKCTTIFYNNNNCLGI
ncbi:MAG: hypothetical protein WCE54_01880 [Ignavibacteriaceae bacterium]